MKRLFKKLFRIGIRRKEYLITNVAFGFID